jgi:hypothetical protein
MDEMLEELKHDFKIWSNSPDKSFLYINERSRVFSRWLSYQEGINGMHHSIIQPINLYSKKLYPAPELISINNNEIVLQQRNHAEFFLLIEDGEFYNVDRPWVRQYYRSDEPHKAPEGCFDGNYRFYISWLINADVSVQIEQAEDSPFFIYPKEVHFKSLDPDITIFDPPMVDFNFKSIGSHMIDEEFGKIPRLQPMFNMRFQADDIMVERVKEFYERNKVLSV